MSKKRRDKTAAKRRQQRVNLDNLGPKIAAGITEGASAREALEQFPVQAKVDGAELASRQLGGDNPGLEGTRIPAPRFVATDDTHSVWYDEPTGRLQRNAVLNMDKDTFEAIKAGHMCLRCLEPHPEAFPDQCDMCGYPMRERQTIDIVMEFRGEGHVGPGAPIAEYLAEQEERWERVEHEIRKREGASPMTAVSRRILSPGVKRLRGLTGRVHADDSIVEKAVKPDAKKD